MTGVCDETGRRTSARDSAEIRVADFRQIFVWPLALDLTMRRPSESMRDLVDAAAASLDAKTRDWKAEPDLLHHAGQMRRDLDRAVSGGIGTGNDDDPDLRRSGLVDRAQTYGEFVYFYDFLQRMIYDSGTGSSRGRPIRLWRHVRLRSVEFDLRLDHGPTREGIKTYRATVERLLVYLFDSGAAVVVTELDFGPPPIPVEDPAASGVVRPLVLADVLTICDQLRRAYTPYFIAAADASGASAGGVPTRVRWTCEGDTPDEARDRESRPADLDEDFRFVDRPRRIGTVGGRPVERREAPVADAWRKILAPLAFAGYGEGRGPIWRHVLDERIPLMSFVSLSGAASTVGSTADGSRCEGGDGGGCGTDGDPASARRADFDLVRRGDWLRLCGADSAGADPMPYNSEFLKEMEQTAFYDRFAADPQTDSATRFLFAGYHFAIVGSGWFFDNLVIHHFRRHYFQMVLLANLELASLLVTSSRISEAVARLRHDDDGHGSGNGAHRRFMDELEDISEWFLTFVHRYRFSGVSNQIQPTEIYDRLRKSMRLDDLYREVKDELEAAVAFNATCEQRRMAASADRLSNVATIGASIGLAFTFLGMNVIIDPIRDLYKTGVGGNDGGDAEQAVVRAVSPVLQHDTALTALSVAGFAGLMLVALLSYAAVRSIALRRLRFGLPDLTTVMLAVLTMAGGVYAWSWFSMFLWPRLH
jgi:hypothetical protein